MKIKLIDGSEINGKFSTDSFAPIYNDCNDVYLEEIYDDNNTIIPNTKGVYIAKDQIQQIILYKEKKK